jgi:hypothetical protein
VRGGRWEEVVGGRSVVGKRSVVGRRSVVGASNQGQPGATRGNQGSEIGDILVSFNQNLFHNKPISALTYKSRMLESTSLC